MVCRSARKKYASSGAARWILGDWQVNTVFAAYTGKPFSVSAAGAALNAPGDTLTADQVKADVDKLGGVGPGQYFFDPKAFAPVNVVRFGNTGRNTFAAPV